MQFTIELRDQVTARLKVAEAEFEKLGGKSALEAVRGLNKVEAANRTLHRSMQDGQPIWTRFTQGIAVGTIAANAAMKAFDVLKETLADSIKEAIEAERAWVSLTNSLERAGIESGTANTKIKEYARSVQFTIGESDEAVADAIRTFIDYGATVEQAIARTKISLDLAYGRNLKLAEASDAVARASMGKGKALNRLVEDVEGAIDAEDKFDKQMALIEKHWNNAALGQIDTYATKVRAAGAAWSEFKEIIGEGLLTIMDKLVEGIASQSVVLGAILKARQAEAEATLGVTEDVIDTASAGAAAQIPIVQELHLMAMDLVDQYAAQSERLAEINRGIAAGYLEQESQQGMDVGPKPISDEFVQYLKEQEEELQKFNEEVTEEQNRAFEEYQQRWAFAAGATEAVFQDMAYAVITDVSDLTNVMKVSFERAAQSIVASLVTKARKAVFDFMAAQVAQKTLQTGLTATEKMAAATTAAKTAATAASTAATFAYGGAAWAAISAMAFEIMAVRALTEAYISLAAAKAAASLGVTSGPSIAAAAGTKAALTGMLGFDDPRNDAIAYLHGRDYAKHFIAGTQSECGSARLRTDRS